MLDEHVATRRGDAHVWAFERRHTSESDEQDPQSSALARNHKFLQKWRKEKYQISDTQEIRLNIKRHNTQARGCRARTRPAPWGTRRWTVKKRC